MIVFGKLKEVKFTKSFIYFTMNNSFSNMQKNKREKHVDEDNQGDGEHKKTHIFERDSSNIDSNSYDASKLSDADKDILKKRQGDISNKESNNKGTNKDSQGMNISKKDKDSMREKGIKQIN